MPGRTIVGLVDYDFFHSALNSAILMGSFQLPAQLDRKLQFRSPARTGAHDAKCAHRPALHDTGRACSVRSRRTEIHELARDRTPMTDLYSLSLTRPLSERFYFALTCMAAALASTPASGGVAADSCERLGAGMYKYNSSGRACGARVTCSLWFGSATKERPMVCNPSVSSRGCHCGAIWRIGPRLRVDRRTLTLDEAEELVYVPALRIDYQRGNTWVEHRDWRGARRRDLAAEDET